MSGVMFALALFGCSDDGTACQRLAGPVQGYESRTACLAAREAALGSDTAMAADYPTVFAQCLDSRQLARLGKGTIDLTRHAAAFASAN
ncbi:hypothetical protein [Novosphingobium album (ex Liu et al. 2023)]|uniref:Lipoprotein n=1 Tax=Novosphingobium album (ex Liu et al. 2023) TaxID=3031130 RepID=A0ABT5WK72_9SPHN|nr:hypothetical protein [Novosphingobium album (ex Liu et al. 2023)]MDE8650440.1 hypothetical protein [Novosphingobium album (ex Liu et al. 2023)]